MVMNRWKDGDYGRSSRGAEEKRWICPPSSELARKIWPMQGKWNIRTILMEMTIFSIILHTQHEQVNKMECSGVYSINCKDCNQNYTEEMERTFSTRINEHQRRCGKMDTEGSEIADQIPFTGHTTDPSVTERRVSYEEYTRKRKIIEAVDIFFQRNLMNRRLEVRSVSDNFAYCLSRLEDSAKTSKGRHLDPGHLFNNRKRHHQGADHKGQREFNKR
ncbi:unnamed protein product [Protopolystoma xenopodis]|uniref:Uncharacterized protein n=1 Tax=Protopolystoma xenopodis TaxID=117903 RepID=A0A448WI44_9PLAT|nr:unnamed protein product [Protopolystoma xenopodis]